MTARQPEVINGLAVREHACGRYWHVVHEASGLDVAGYLRQRRFADQARAELLATGVDWTLGKAEAAKAVYRQDVLRIYERWWKRARNPFNDPVTHEYYSATLHMTRPNSAARAAQLREADRRAAQAEYSAQLAAWETDGGA